MKLNYYKWYLIGLVVCSGPIFYNEDKNEYPNPVTAITKTFMWPLWLSYEITKNIKE